MSNSEKVEKILEKKKEGLLRKVKKLKKIEIKIDEDKQGHVLTNLMAKTKKRTIYLKEKGDTLEAAINNVFKKLKVILTRKKGHKNKRITLDFENVV